MTLPFMRVGKTPLAVSEKFAEGETSVILDGKLEYFGNKLIKLTGTLKGSCMLACDRCAEEFIEKIDEPVELLISEGIYSRNEEEEEKLSWPVMEMQNDRVDLEEILQSELATFMCDYHRCTKCETGLTNFELTQGE